MTDPSISINNELDGICNGFGSTDEICKEKTRTDDHMYNFLPRPYPAPNPNFYAVLEKPGVNRYVMRGCFKSNSGDDEKDIPLWAAEPTREICDDYVGSYCHGRKNICKTDAPGGLADFTHPMPIQGKKYLKNGFIVKQCECTLNYDPRGSDDHHHNQLDDQPVAKLEDNGLTKRPTKYTCWKEKHQRLEKYDMVDPCCKSETNKLCIQEGYRINNSLNNKPGSKSLTGGNLNSGKDNDVCTPFWFPGSEWNEYQNGELWSGELWTLNIGDYSVQDQPYTCYDWYNPALGELDDDKKDKNNCTQYLLKWAHSCKWCLKPKHGINNWMMEGSPTNDYLARCGKAWDGKPAKECDDDDDDENDDDAIPCIEGGWKGGGINGCKNGFECGGGWEGVDGCNSTAGGFLPDSCDVNEMLASKTGEKDKSCKLCESELWDLVPGGWEALIDENHPKHIMAKFSYIPKVVKTKNTDSCKQPTAVMEPLNKIPILVTDLDSTEDQRNQSRTTTFTKLGPLEHYDRAFGYDKYEFSGNQFNKLMSCAEESWVNNLNITREIGLTDGSIIYPDDGENIIDSPNICDYDIFLDQDNKIEKGNSSVWSIAHVAGNPNSGINDQLNSCNIHYGFDIDDNIKSHLMCERNPNLTGYGECDLENSVLAHLWVEGLWDMSKYVQTTEYSKYGLDEKGIMSEGVSEEELKERRIESVRCCLGLTPKYTTNTNDYNSIDDTSERFEGCRPGFLCPSSIGCSILLDSLFSREWDEDQGGFDSYYFGENYPEKYNLAGSEELTNEIMQNTAYYAKAYCQEMSGGKRIDDLDINTGCGRSKDAIIGCRKMMYNYCSESVEMELQESEVGNDVKSTKIKYPTRIFTDNCFGWCDVDSDVLETELPDQEGVCDMMVGKTCQQLQVDGWINPYNWEASKILKFADKDGEWYENRDTSKTHTGLDAQRLKDICGCFLLGSECGNKNCSISYCGAGTDGNKGPGPVKIFNNADYPENNPYNFEVDDMKTIYDYDGLQQSTTKWTDSIDADTFDCRKDYIDGSSTGKCFTGCNYVNYNDTCWLANPEERRQNTIFSQETFKNYNDWECGDRGHTIGDSCDPYNKTYGCFGYCNMGEYNENSPEGNCGTPDWFNHKMGITPNEVKYKTEKQIFESNPQLNNLKANKSRYWPKWQNFYVNWNESAYLAPPGTVKVPGWGSFKVGNNGKPSPYNNTPIQQDQNQGLCNYPACSGMNALKPYSIQKSEVFGCGTTCSVSLQTNITNQGYVGGGIISTLNGEGACKTENTDWETSVLSATERSNYATYMGSNNCNSILDSINTEPNKCLGCYSTSTDPQCTTQSNCTDLLKEQKKCIVGSQMCINPKILASDDPLEGDFASGDNCQLCIGNKPNICCMSPNLNPYTTSAEKLSWENENKTILDSVGNRVSYICYPNDSEGLSQCPNGSVKLKELESQNCGNTLCDQRNSESTCNNCDVCIWIPEDLENGIEAHCSAQCPLPPQVEEGWNVGAQNLTTDPPTQQPTDQPTEPPTDQPTDQPTEPPSTESIDSSINIGVIVLGIIGGLLVGSGVSYLAYKYYKKPNVLKTVKSLKSPS